MDSQGFVLLSVLLKFNRIKQLTSDIDLIRFICLRSLTIEIRSSPDGIDRLRKAEDWQPWVLIMEERDPAAQNDGPPPVPVHQNQVYSPPDEYRGPGSTSAMSPRSPVAAAQYQMEPLALQAPAETTTMATVPRVAAGKLTNGHRNDVHSNPAALSAAVPDFTPHLQIPNHYASPAATDSQGAVENSFSDEQVESLMIVIRKPMNAAAPLRAPFASTVSRTFSNGSIDGRTISDELLNRADSQAASSASGDHPLAR
jgi:la-related protein 1